MLLCALPGRADDELRFDIPSQRADRALTRFAEQAGLSVLFPFTEIRERTANALRGEYTIEEGLEILLEDTGLEAGLAEGVLRIEVLEEPSRAASDTEPAPETRQSRDIVSMVERLGDGSRSAQHLVYAREPEEITVTGSRIERATGFTTAVPMTTVTRRELAEIAPGSTTSEALDALPQFYATQTPQRGGHPVLEAGRSALNMRGMGAKRTLVLVNGVRTVPVDRSSRVNVSNIPTALIERVDVVTGGASAAYGADALAGVTNFILDDDFEGFDANLRVGATSEGDGRNWNLSLAGGAPLGGDERWHVTWSVESQKVAQIMRNAADEEIGGWFRRVGMVQNPEWTPEAPPGIPQRLVMPKVHSTLHTPTGLINEPGFSLDRHRFLADGGGTRAFQMGEVGCYKRSDATCTIDSTSGGPEFHLADRAFDDGPFGAEVERNSAFVGLTFDMNEHTELYGRMLAGATESNMLDFRGNPHLMGVWHATAFAENPYLPDSVRDTMISEGFEEVRVDKLGQLRGDSFRNFNDYQDNLNKYTTWSLAFGFERALFDSEDWRLEGRVQRGESDKDAAVLGEARVDRMFLAMDAVEVYPDRRDVNEDGVVDVVSNEDRGSGEIICNVQRYDPTERELAEAVADVRVPASIGDDSLGAPDDLVPIPGPVATTDNTIRDCVPLNIFGAGNVSPQAQEYVTGDKHYVGTVEQKFAELLVRGDLTNSLDAGPIGLAAGWTYREESFRQRSLPRDLMAFGPPVNAPHLGIRGISSGWRGNRNVHHFSDFPAIGGGFDVTELFAELDLPLLETRAGRSLSANLAWRRSDYSLSGPITSAKLGLDAAIAPSVRFRTTWSRDVREPTFSERFDFQGGAANIRDPAFGGRQYETISVDGGNPGLGPEEADTLTAGLVIQPRDVPALRAAVDYYEIDLTRAVDQLGVQGIVDQCYTANSLCGQIRRDPDTHVITLIENVFLNISDAFVRGIDFELLWDSDVDFTDNWSESLDVRLLAGSLIENSETPQGGTKIHQAGGIDHPELTVLGTANYRFGPYRLRLQQRYISETLLNTSWVEGIDIDDNTVESQLITNLTFGYRRNLGDGRAWEASLTVNNLLGVDPPVIPEYWDRGGAQTVSNNYDVFGRRFSLEFDYEF